MLPQQKGAVYVLVVLGLSILAVVALAPSRGAGALSVFWLGLPLATLVMAACQHPDGSWDERDRAFRWAANQWAGAASYVAFVLALLGFMLYFVAEGARTMPVVCLRYVLFAGWLGVLAGRSVALLVLYHRGGGDAED